MDAVEKESPTDNHLYRFFRSWECTVLVMSVGVIFTFVAIFILLGPNYHIEGETSTFYYVMVFVIIITFIVIQGSLYLAIRVSETSVHAFNISELPTQILRGIALIFVVLSKDFSIVITGVVLVDILTLLPAMMIMWLIQKKENQISLKLRRFFYRQRGFIPVKQDIELPTPA
jgi:hypothetical protein